MAQPTADSIFTKIIKAEIPCQRVFENEHVLGFLDITPLSEGHTLVVPKRQVKKFADLTPDEASAIARVLGPLAERVCKAVGVVDYNILLNDGESAGQEVPHVHFHIIPRRPEDGLGYRWKAKPADPSELEELCRRISDVVQ